MIANAAGHGKRVIKASLTEVIKEKAADAALLVSVPQVEIVIASCFESRVEVTAKPRASLQCRLVPVNGISLVTIVWCEVKAPTEPPYRPLWGLRAEEPDIHVGGRDKGLSLIHI